MPAFFAGWRRPGGGGVFEPRMKMWGGFASERPAIVLLHNKFNLNSIASARNCARQRAIRILPEERGFRIPRSEVFLQDAYRSGSGAAKAVRGEQFAAELADVY